MIETGDSKEMGINGGLIERKKKAEGESVIAYVCTVGVKSIKEIEKNIIENKGKIHIKRTEIEGVGFLTYFKDSEGNIFGAMQPTMEMQNKSKEMTKEMPAM